jgi:hypothetical protein
MVMVVYDLPQTSMTQKVKVVTYTTFFQFTKIDQMLFRIFNVIIIYWACKLGWIIWIDFFISNL